MYGAILGDMTGAPYEFGEESTLKQVMEVDSESGLNLIIRSPMAAMGTALL